MLGPCLRERELMADDDLFGDDQATPDDRVERERRDPRVDRRKGARPGRGTNRVGPERRGLRGRDKAEMRSDAVSRGRILTRRPAPNKEPED